MIRTDTVEAASCFTGGDGEPKAIRLGKATVKAAESFRLRVEALLSNLELRQHHDAELCAWINALPEKMHKRLAAKLGLVANPGRRCCGGDGGKVEGPIRRGCVGEARDASGVQAKPRIVCGRPLARIPRWGC